MHGTSQLSPEADACVEAACAVIAKLVDADDPDVIGIRGGGADGPIMEAARQLRRAHELHPADAALHFAYASSLRLAMQGREATAEMQRVATRHPTFEYARIALRNWEHLWMPAFTLPWIGADGRIPASIARDLLPDASFAYAIKDGLLPATALLFRDASVFGDRAALRAARIEIATVISDVTQPQVVGLYARVWDRPTSPMMMEVAYTPFLPRGARMRTTWEYLAVQRELSFIVVDLEDRIVHRATIAFPAAMRRTNERLDAMFEAADGRGVSDEEYVVAVRRHQAIFPEARVFAG